MNSPLPYRLGVGLVIVNSQSEIFTGRRLDNTKAWQMPQGGIDSKEKAELAALREMEEEGGINKNKVKLLPQSKEWYYYSIPKDLAQTLWKGKFKGQKQKWFLYQFNGTKNDINIETEHPEFSDWKWVSQDFLVPNIVPFKKKIYTKLLEEFEDYL